MDEILGLANRIAVMHASKIVASLPRAQAATERLDLLMAGVTQRAPHGDASGGSTYSTTNAPS